MISLIKMWSFTKKKKGKISSQNQLANKYNNETIAETFASLVSL